MDNDIKEDVTPEGTVEKPTQQVQEGIVAGLSADDVQKLAEALRPLVSQDAERLAQSVKDKRFAKQEAKLSEFESKLARFTELTKQGLSEEDAKWRMRVEEQLFGNKSDEEVSDVSSTKATGTSKVTTGGTEVDPEIFGLDPNDPAVVEFQRQGKSMSDFYAFAVSQKSKAKQPAPGSVMSSGEGGGVSSEDAEALTQRLNEINLHPTKYAKERKEISEKLRKLIAEQ